MKNSEDLKKYISQFENQHILVFGDVMLDIYHRGSVNRISPEAPVPVVNIDKIVFHPGGAANVAMNLKSLGAKVDLVGIIGDDTHGEILRHELDEIGIGTAGLISVTDRSTTAKTRVIAGSQHVVRTDLESRAPISSEVEDQLLDFVQSHKISASAVILQDYNKGVLQPRGVTEVIDQCRRDEILVTVDPKFEHFFDYRHASIVKPNLKEVEQILGRAVKTDEQIRDAGRELLERLESDYLLITLGDRGMELFGDGFQSERIPTVARQVADVSGAGDTVIATVTMAMTAGASAEEAAYLGNLAAGRVCEIVGIAPITLELLNESLSEGKKSGSNQ